MSHLSVPLFELLEPRQLLASAIVTPPDLSPSQPQARPDAQVLMALEPAPAPRAPWPTALLAGRKPTTVYVNQFGNAVLKRQSFRSFNDLKVYEIYFDDPGRVTVRTTGKVGTEMALYRGTAPLPPAATSGAADGRPSITQGVEPKSPYYVALRPHSAIVSGTFTLEVQGVPHAVIKPVQLGKGYRSSRLTTVNAPYDADDDSFTAPVAGVWNVTVAPAGPLRKLGSLDATLMIFDSSGKPIGGGYKRAINAGRQGVAESWSGTLAEGAQIVIRIDGFGKSIGWYHIRVRLVQRI